MNTPVCDFVKNYALSESARLHMPGHKGKSILGFEHLDITEIEGADVLYSAKGIIKESMENASSLFSASKTLYSTEGSSLSIRAMLFLTSLYAKEQNKKPIVLAGRNAHKAFLSGVALTDIEVQWLYPEGNKGLLSCKITPEDLRAYLESSKEKPVALYITSPDYLGNTSDIKGISDVCKAFDVLLLVDNAHGAYLNFTEENMHPISLGAHICCDSAHKTLPVLTGGGYLHVGKSAPKLFLDEAENAMSLFASSSPSYLILQSLDMANKYMSEGYREKLTAFCKKANQLKDALKEKGYTLTGDEALKITIDGKKYGYEGTELAQILYNKGIVCEFCDPDYLVLMLSAENSDHDLRVLEDVLLGIDKKEKIFINSPHIGRLTKALGIKEALMSQSEEVTIDNAEGRILANYAISCPPAIPIAVCGEVIDKNAIEAFRYYGIEKIRIVK